MPERVFRGTPASPGVALGTAWRLGEQTGTQRQIPVEHRARERGTALTALAAAAKELIAVAAGLPPAEAEIVQASALMAQDPALSAAVERAIVDHGAAAGEAIIGAATEYADTIESIGDEMLAARSDDVRSLGRRAARLTTSREAVAPPGSELILIAHDLGPADIAEVASVLAGVALVGGGATAHAAIVARSLGVPMATGLPEPIQEIADGATLAVDGTTGTLTLEPSVQSAGIANQDMAARRVAAHRAHELRDQPAITSDGERVTVLANVAGPGELELALRSGAEGIGLLRTELAFLDAHDWPTEMDHAEAVEGILAGLEGRPAVVRVLDFGADKSPPFLSGTAQRGLELLLAHPAAFTAQLRAILLAARDRDVRILLPMVDTPEQLVQARDLIDRTAAGLRIERIPPIGSMIETPLAAQGAGGISAHSDFLSIGTNDLTAATLSADRFAANNACAHHPLVLRSVARSIAAAHDANIPLEVCGEAASNSIMLPLLVGLGVDEVSVGAARVGEVRTWIRHLSAAETAGLARSALTMDTAEEVESAVSSLGAAALLP